jgi:hypothetical protein
MGLVRLRRILVFVWLLSRLVVPWSCAACQWIDSRSSIGMPVSRLLFRICRYRHAFSRCCDLPFRVPRREQTRLGTLGIIFSCHYSSSLRTDMGRRHHCNRRILHFGSAALYFRQRILELAKPHSRELAYYRATAYRFVTKQLNCGSVLQLNIFFCCRDHCVLVYDMLDTFHTYSEASSSI